MNKGTSKNLLRSQSAALGSARNLAYLADMSRLLRAGRLASWLLITIFRGALVPRGLVVFFLVLFAVSGFTAETADEALYLQAEEAFKKQDFSGAIRLLTNALKQNKQSLSAYLLLLRIYTDHDDYRNTLRILDTMEKNVPGEEIVFQFKADYYNLREKLDDAGTYYKKCIDFKTLNYYCHIGLASIYHRQNKPDEGIQLLNDVLENFKDKTLLYNYMSGYYVMKKDYDNALIFINKALLLDPSFLLTYVNAAGTLNKMGKHQEALIFLETVEKERPDDREINLNKGIAYLGLNRPDLAISSFDLVLTKSPTDPIAIYNKALCLFKTKRSKEGMELLRKGLPLTKEDSDVGQKIRIKIKELQNKAE